jgi:hypothetical protein
MKIKLNEDEIKNVSVQNGKIIIDGHKYELQAKLGFWKSVDVESIIKSNQDWKIKASVSFLPSVNEIIPKDKVNYITQHLGEREIMLGGKTPKKLVKLNQISESYLKKVIKKVLHEQKSQRYMFFQNLEQMKRQCDHLLSMDENQLTSILEDGHDWAQDHISEAKNNMDQVFDFIINQVNDSEEETIMMEGRKKSGTKLCSRGKSAAKAKFKVYPSAYANGYAVQVCKGKMPGSDGKKKCSPPYC